MNRSGSTWLVTLTATMVIWSAQAWCGAGLEAAALPELLPDEPELFLDDLFVAGCENVKTELQQAEKCEANPVVKQDKPWESFLVCYPRVVVNAESGKFMMYYGTRERGNRVCYAESNDGVRWVKPELDLHPYREHKRTNIVLPNVLWFWPIHNPDPNAPADQRFLGFGCARMDEPRPGKGGKMVRPKRSVGYASPDGVHWKKVMDTHSGRDTFFSVAWCAADRRFRAYVRGWREHEDYGKLRYDAKMPQFRTVCVMESSDFVTWSRPAPLLETDVTEGAPLVQVYGLGVTRYGSGLVGALSVLYIDESVEGWQRGHQDTQLVASRDGINWCRVADRATFIPHGPEGAFDWGEAYYSGGVFGHGDKTYCYYAGKSTLHKGPGQYAIGLATLPRDRLIALSQEDPSRPAIVETEAFRCRGSQLLVNSTGKGNLQVEVLDADGKPLPGYSATGTRLAPAGSIYQTVVWKTDDKAHTLADLGERLQAGIRLRFRLESVRLHAFKVAE